MQQRQSTKFAIILLGAVIVVMLMSTRNADLPVSASPQVLTPSIWLPVIVQAPLPTQTPITTSTPTPTQTPLPKPTRTPWPTDTPISTPDLRLVQLSGLSMPEYVIIQNVGTSPQNMTGWYLLSIVGSEIFYFPSDYILTAGQSVRIESKTDTPNISPGVLFWTHSEIWNDEGDKAELWNSSGALISSLCYGSACP